MGLQEREPKQHPDEKEKIVVVSEQENGLRKRSVLDERYNEDDLKPLKASNSKRVPSLFFKNERTQFKTE